MTNMAGTLVRFTKEVLLLLAEEFDTSVSLSDKKREIIEAITSASDYDEQFMRDCLDSIIKEKEREREEKERDREKQERGEREEREREEKEREREEKERERKYELEKLRLQNASETSSVNLSNVSEANVNRQDKIKMKDFVPKLDLNSSDITLFFSIFERQAEKFKIPEDDYVSQLLSLLPSELAEIVVKEPREKSDDYAHIKGVLLKRFRLSTGALKSKFFSHQKKGGALWSELVYELRSYLENWLESVEVSDFEALKELMLAEQIKRRVPFEIRDKYIDVWDELKSANEVADKCDKYESVRSHIRRTDKKTFEKNNDQKYKSSTARNVNEIRPKVNDNKFSEKNSDNWRKERSYERAKEVTCYNCSAVGHIRPNCPELNRNLIAEVNNIEVNLGLDKDFKPYVKYAEINGKKRQYLRDTGSMVDICNKNMINDRDLLKEVVWIQTPFENKLKCLPLARITIEGDFGKVITKAAVRPTNVERDYYILGNKTAKLIDNCEKVRSINAEMIKNQNKKIELACDKLNKEKVDFSNERNSHCFPPKIAMCSHIEISENRVEECKKPLSLITKGIEFSSENEVKEGGKKEEPVVELAKNRKVSSGEKDPVCLPSTDRGRNISDCLENIAKSELVKNSGVENINLALTSKENDKDVQSRGAVLNEVCNFNTGSEVNNEIEDLAINCKYLKCNDEFNEIELEKNVSETGSLVCKSKRPKKSFSSIKDCTQAVKVDGDSIKLNRDSENLHVNSSNKLNVLSDERKFPGLSQKIIRQLAEYLSEIQKNPNSKVELREKNEKTQSGVISHPKLVKGLNRKDVTPSVKVRKRKVFSKILVCKKGKNYSAFGTRNRRRFPNYSVDNTLTLSKLQNYFDDLKFKVQNDRNPLIFLKKMVREILDWLDGLIRKE